MVFFKKKDQTYKNTANSKHVVFFLMVPSGFILTTWSHWERLQSPNQPSLLQDTRLKLFNDYVECGEDFAQVEGIFQSRLEESQKSTAKYGFRNDVWLVKHHGQKKADKIMARKKSLGLILGST